MNSPDGAPKGPKSPRGADEGLTSYGEYAGIGLQFAGAIILFLYVGRWLDRRLGTAPWLLITGVFLGAGAGFYSMYRKLMAGQAREEAARLARKQEQGP